MNIKARIIAVRKASNQAEYAHLLRVSFQEEGKEETQDALMTVKESATAKATEGMKAFVKKLIDAANTKVAEDGTVPAEKFMTINVNATVNAKGEPQLFIQAEDYRITDADAFLAEI